MLISFYSLRPKQQFSDISRRVFNAWTYVVFSGPMLLCFSRVLLVLLFDETKRLLSFVLRCMLRTTMVVGCPGIVADAIYDVINMAPVKNLI